MSKLIVATGHKAPDSSAFTTRPTDLSTLTELALSTLPAADLAAFQRVGIVPPGMAQGMAQHEATVTRLLRELKP